MEQYLNPNYAPLAAFGVGNIGLLVVRVLFGVIFLYYGLPKIRDLKSNASDFEAMGFTTPSGWFWGTPVALLESFGAAAIILGLFTWFFAVGFAIHMTTGMIWKITSTEKPFTDWSYDMLAFCVAVLLLVTGPGTITLQALLGIGV
jgi:uncharacterized membrane protein YphA (DoxX/SURF4 family)